MYLENPFLQCLSIFFKIYVMSMSLILIVEDSD